MKVKNNLLEAVVHGIFLLLGLVTVACVLLITGYLVISGIPAIRQIGLGNFLFGETWASTAAEPKFGILPFILTSVYGNAGAILLVFSPPCTWRKWLLPPCGSGWVRRYPCWRESPPWSMAWLV